MQTFLILSVNQDFIEQEINRFKKELKVSPFDVTEIKPETSLGIETVRQLIKDSQITPYQGTKRLIIIRDFQKATTEAQNALLKFLEEVISSTTILLTAENERYILPTVLSRSQLIKDKRKKENKKIDDRFFEETVLHILSGTAGQRLIFVQKKITSKEDALLFIRNFTGFLQTLLLDRNSSPLLTPVESAGLIRKVTTARQFLDNNVNYKLVLDILLLGLPFCKR